MDEQGAEGEQRKITEEKAYSISMESKQATVLFRANVLTPGCMFALVAEQLPWDAPLPSLHNISTQGGSVNSLLN